MNTTRSMPEPHDAYTVVGNPQAPVGGELGLLVLNRSSRINRDPYLQSIASHGISEVVFVEPQANSYSVETGAHMFPQFRFLLLARDLNAGEQINAGLSEMSSTNVLVLWSTMSATRATESVAKRIQEWRAVVVVPLLRNEAGEIIPSVQIPSVQQRSLHIDVREPRTDGSPSLFPADYAGIYNRERFFEVGGYDGAIRHPYWQKMDFGMRVHLWGGRILVHTGLRVDYRSTPPPEDRTVTRDHALFFFKNLSIRINSSGANIPWTEVLRFSIRSIFRGRSHTWRRFREARRWVAANRVCFLRDVRSVVRDWPQKAS